VAVVKSVSYHTGEFKCGGRGPLLFWEALPNPSQGCFVLLSNRQSTGGGGDNSAFEGEKGGKTPSNRGNENRPRGHPPSKKRKGAKETS